MVQIHGMPDSKQHKQKDLLSKIDGGLDWLVVQWRAVLILIAVLILATAGVAWFKSKQHSESSEAAKAYALAQAATEEKEVTLKEVIESYPSTIYADLARLELAKKSIEANNSDGARKVLEPMLGQSGLAPLLEATTYEWMALSFELEGNWEEAAAWYQKILATNGSGVDVARALRNTVRSFVKAGQTDAAEKVLNANYPNIDDEQFNQTLETEKLWLAIPKK